MLHEKYQNDKKNYNTSLSHGIKFFCIKISTLTRDEQKYRYFRKIKTWYRFWYRSISIVLHGPSPLLLNMVVTARQLSVNRYNLLNMNKCLFRSERNLSIPLFRCKNSVAFRNIKKNWRGAAFGKIAGFVNQLQLSEFHAKYLT